MKFLKLTMSIEIQIVQPVGDEAVVGSMLEEILADADGLKDMENQWQQQIGGDGAEVKNYSILEADIVEV